MSLLRFAAIVLFVLALVCLVIPVTIADANWPTWTVAGLLAWLLDGTSAVNINIGGKS